MNPSISGDLQLSNWIKQQPITKATVDISIIVPAFNEERRLPPTLIDIIDYFDKHSASYEVIVVDDGSSDQTASVVEKFERVRPQVRLIRLPKNYGKGHAVRLGVLNSHGLKVLFADADGATPIAEVTRLLNALDGGAEIAIGSRAAYSSETKVSTVFYRKLLGRVFNGCVNFLILPGISDTQCGFKIFSKSAAAFLFQNQKSDRFSFDVELLYLARKVGLKITEVPINWQNIPGSKVNLIVDSLKMFRDIFRFKLIHRGVTEESFATFKTNNLK